MTLPPISEESRFVSSLEEFLAKAEIYLRCYYNGDTVYSDAKEILDALQNFNLDLNQNALEKEMWVEELEADYHLHCDQQEILHLGSDF